MSDLNQIHTALDRLFNEQGHRIVFWHDPDREFLNTLPFVSLEGVTNLRIDKVGALDAKILIERQEADTKFLLYAPSEEPDPQDDWLLDIRLYSESFRADRASILLQELGLLTASLRKHLLKYRKFFDAKDRIQKIKGLVAPDDTAPDLDRKMMAVIAKADQPEMFNLVRTIFHAWVEVGSGRQAAGSEAVADSANSHLPTANSLLPTANCLLPSADCDLDNPPAVFSQIEKFDLDLPFWQMAKATFGYEEENPSLKNFLLRLVLTDFAHHLKGDVPQAIRGLLLPKTGWSNAVVCLAQWRDSSSKGNSYDRLSEWLREMRKRNFGDAINKYFKLGRDLNQRDTIAVKHTVSGLLKLLYPNEQYDKKAVRRCLEYSLEARRRVKEQLKKIGGMEFFDVHFSYIDTATLEEKFISVPEQGGGSLIPDGPLNPGVMHTVATGGSGSHLGLYRLETQVTAGNGALKTSGLGSNSAAKEAIKVGFDYFKANAHRVSASIKAGEHDYHLHVVELHNTGPMTAMTLSAFRSI